MKINDRVKQDFEAIKNGTPQEKLQFFWDYYKWPAIIAVAVVAVIVSTVVSIVTAKETYLSGITLNSYHMSPEAPYGDLVEDFMNAQQADPAAYEFEINTTIVYSADASNLSEENYYALQRIGAQVAAHDLDFATGDLDTMTALAYSRMFVDLSTLLSEEQLTAYAPYLRYIDLALADSDVILETLPDSARPETMQDPIPVLIDMSGCGYLAEGYAYLAEPLAFGIAVNAPHEARAISLLDFLMSDVMTGKQD